MPCHSSAARAAEVCWKRFQDHRVRREKRGGKKGGVELCGIGCLHAFKDAFLCGMICPPCLPLHLRNLHTKCQSVLYKNLNCLTYLNDVSQCNYSHGRVRGGFKSPERIKFGLLSFQAVLTRVYVYLSLQHAGVVVAPLLPQLLTFLGNLNDLLVDGLDLCPVLLQVHQRQEVSTPLM